MRRVESLLHWMDGIAVDPGKKRAKGKIGFFSAPDSLTVPLPGITDEKACCAAVGDRIKRAQTLAVLPNGDRVCAPLSGTVREISCFSFSSGATELCVRIEPDSSDCTEGEPGKKFHWDTESAREIIAGAGIIDELDGRPLTEKLDKKTDMMVICCAGESVQEGAGEAVAVQMKEDVEIGIRLLQEMTHIPRCVMFTANRALKREYEGVDLPLEWIFAHKRYPACTLLRKYFEQEERTCVFFGVQAVAALGRARKGLAQLTTVLEISGDAMDRPVFLEVPVGSDVLSVLRACSWRGSGSIYLGDCVTGQLWNRTEPVTQTTRCISVFRKMVKPGYPICIGCGRCEKACPAGVRPWVVCQPSQDTRSALAAMCRAERCIGCGACSAVCPAALDPAASVQAVSELNRKAAETKEVDAK